MRKPMFFLILSIILIFYFLLNAYLFHRGYNALKETKILKKLFLIMFIFLILAYPLGRFFHLYFRSVIIEFLVIAGSFYLGMMVYFFIFIFIIDILRIINSFIPIFPSFLSLNPAKTTQISFYTVWCIVIAITFVSHINALFPRIRSMEIEIEKPGGELEGLNIAAVTDIHLGTVILNSRLRYIVDKINSLSPDIILLPGDIVDEDVSSVMEQNMASILKRLKATFGVYAITGNHEYIGGVKEAVKYIRDGNITVLMDSTAKIANSFYLIGRKDLVAKSFGDSRNSLENILAHVDKSLPLILMDHQPFNLEEAETNGIDFQISGHTHHGQLFPFNFITKRVYEKSWGYLRKNSTQYYISCGVGTWGPPLRLGNRPEILNIKVLFAQKQSI